MLVILGEYGLTAEEGKTIGYITLGAQYTLGGEFVCGETEDVKNLLVENAPDASFTIYEEPALDGVGQTFSYVPKLDTFYAFCANEGVPLLPQSLVRKALGESATERRRTLGLSWRTAISKLKAGLVLAPGFHSAYLNPGDGRVAVECEERRNDKAFALGKLSYDNHEANERLSEWGFACVNEWIPLDAARKRQVRKKHPYWFQREQILTTVVQRINAT
ncbi:hypothetical protein ADL03_15855 [Nocardia sp. NRRL S-836]|nr:hypothetical protein ADL03_15855 [Nocardia sp. NRRL S-836]